MGILCARRPLCSRSEVYAMIAQDVNVHAETADCNHANTCVADSLNVMNDIVMNNETKQTAMYGIPLELTFVNT